MDHPMCPICLNDIILGEYKNLVITECGHTFHCSCLMTNISHNGFDCPYCRAEMVEDHCHCLNDGFVDDETFEEELYDDNALTSFRMFQQQIAGEPVEVDEYFEEGVEWITDEEDEADDEPIIYYNNPVSAWGPEVQYEKIVEPDATYVSNKLQEDKVTFNDIVKYMLYNNHSRMGLRYKDYSQYSNMLEMCIDDIIENYEPEPVPNIAESKGNNRRNVEAL